MNALEDMIRRAAQATADEVRPDSLPSPRLPVSRHQGRASGLRFFGRRWMVALAAATAVVAVAVASAVVTAGSSQAPAAHGRHRSESAAATGGKLSASQIAIDNNQVVGLFMAATGAQSTAGAQLWGLMQALTLDGTARCVAAQGFTTRVGNAPPALWATIKEGTNLTDPDLAQMVHDGSLAPIVTFPTAPNGSKRFQAHEAVCQTTSGRPFTPIWNAGYAKDFISWPTAAELKTIHASAGERATLPGLAACAARHGAPSGPVTSAYKTFTGWILSQLKIPGQVGGVSSAVLNRRSRHLEPIFVTCAGPYVRVQDSLELGLQNVFLRQHRKQLQALEALTHRVIAQQQRLDGVPVPR
jgi:hypothetical protein